MPIEFLFAIQELVAMRDADLGAQKTAESVAKEHKEQIPMSKEQEGEHRGEKSDDTAVMDPNVPNTIQNTTSKLYTDKTIDHYIYLFSRTTADRTPLLISCTICLPTYRSC